MPEALLSSRLCYKFRDRDLVTPLSLVRACQLGLHELRFRTGYHQRLYGGAVQAALAPGVAPPPPKLDMPGEKPVTVTSGAYKAERVYCPHGLFRAPNPAKPLRRRFARSREVIDGQLTMTVSPSAWYPCSLPPSPKTACWYADDDIYRARLWDIVPEIQVAGVTENGALRLHLSPLIHSGELSSDSSRISPGRTLIIGLGILMTSRVGGITMIIIGLLLLIASPRLFVYSQSGRIVSAQPWFIGVKGVVSITEVENHLYGGARGHFPRMYYTPSGSQFSIPERGTERGGSYRQYDYAKLADSGPD
ncbi:hypothetical protein EDD22DRAFT_955859 [Suillus occidentalis]|nr:hypothetical protein EDD22DRAFT_955859 [Suillus occidentalis]